MKDSDILIGIDIDKLLHEPARLKIKTFLNIIKRADFVFMIQKTGLTNGDLSSHLSKLEDAGIVETTKEFIEKTPRTMVTLTKKGGEEFIRYREDV